MADIHTDPLDEQCDAIAERLAAACRDEPDHLVMFELVVRLGECIGHYPLNTRNSLLTVVEVELRHYVDEIPPLPTDAYPGSRD